VATQAVVDEQATAVAAVEPNAAVVDPGTNPVPVTITTRPPSNVPAVGVISVTVGATS